MTREALFVDLYELTMLDAYRRAGMADRRATFSLFVRTLPATRGYLVAAGLDDGLRWLEELAFGDDELGALEQLDLFEPEFLDWLAALRFTGAVRAVAEGSIVFPQEPILEVDAPIAEAQIAETFLLNQVTLQTTLATKAARCRDAAAGRAVVDFAFRRCQGADAAMKLARVSRLVGLAGTSNVAGALEYDLPVSGTMAHSFVQAHENERAAFECFAAVYGNETVLLVDTYDTYRGIEVAIDVATACRGRGIELRGIRLDSGDLATLAHHARARLDVAGFSNLQIFASGGLDEHDVERLVTAARAPIDGFGIGTALGVSDDAPTLDTVYKLVAFDGRPVRKTSTGKATLPGGKQVWRAGDWSHDVVALASEATPGPGFVPLLAPVMRDGGRTAAGHRDLTRANEHFEIEWSRLPRALQHLTEPAAHRVVVSPRLAALTTALDEHSGTGEARGS
jgi:nicotinate phosphoribosyltransferase